MKIAVGIIGLFLGLIVLLQSCAVTAGSGLLDDKATGGAGAIGMVVGLVFFIGGAFSFGLPLVGGIMFIVAGLLAFIGSATGDFGDLNVWGFVALVMGVLALLAWRSAKKAKVTS